MLAFGIFFPKNCSKMCLHVHVRKMSVSSCITAHLTDDFVLIQCLLLFASVRVWTIILLSMADWIFTPLPTPWLCVCMCVCVSWWQSLVGMANLVTSLLHASQKQGLLMWPLASCTESPPFTTSHPFYECVSACVRRRGGNRWIIFEITVWAIACMHVWASMYFCKNLCAYGIHFIDT